MSLLTSTCRDSEQRDEIRLHAAEQAADRAGDVLAAFLSRVEPRQPQQVAHQSFHAQGVARDDLEEAPRTRRLGAAVEERLDVAADRGERRAQLVRDVGHEVAAHAIGAAQLGDVVQHDARRRWRGRRDRGAADRHDEAVRQRQLEALAFLAAGRAPR